MVLGLSQLREGLGTDGVEVVDAECRANHGLAEDAKRLPQILRQNGGACAEAVAVDRDRDAAA